MTGGGGSRPTRDRSSFVDQPLENNLIQFDGPCRDSSAIDVQLQEKNRLHFDDGGVTYP